VTRPGGRRRHREGAKEGAKEGAQVVWRDGVHLAGTPLWCDARRARGVCFLSSADKHEVRGAKQIIATEVTLALLGLRRSLAVPYWRPFSLGTVRLELIPSGAAVGAASLSVDVGGPRIVYAGAVDPIGGRVADAAEVRTCDTLVIEARYGHPRFRFPPAATVLEEVAAWVQRALADGRTPVLLAAPVATGPTLLGLLGERHTVGGHRRFVEMARRLRKLGHALPAVAPRGEVLLWPIGAAPPPPPPRARNPRVALVSGLAQEPGAAARLGAEALFPLGEQADHEALLGYVERTRASRVHVLGAGASELASVLGARAARLGPAEQLTLID
jgi:putative mRNA 3-end processing factor